MVNPAQPSDPTRPFYHSEEQRKKTEKRKLNPSMNLIEHQTEHILMTIETLGLIPCQKPARKWG